MLLLFANSSWASRIVIQGRPLELILHQGFYKFPNDYVQENRGYHFIEILHVARVCYIHPKTDLGALEMIPIIIEEKGQKLQWYCYRYDQRFFEIDY